MTCASFRNLIISFLTISLCVLSCKEKQPDPDYDRSDFLTNMADTIIVPAFENAVKKADSLVYYTSAFTENPTASNLTNLQIQWKITSLAWAGIQIYDFGPAMEQDLKSSVDVWPVSSSQIENLTTVTAASFNQSYINGVESNKKGLPAIEYLIFYPQTDSVLAAFSTKTHAETRKAYLKELSINIYNKINSVKDTWKNEYRTAFINNKGVELGTSTNYLTNHLIMYLEHLLNAKLGIPSGNKPVGSTIKPSLIENPYSKFSIAVMLENINVIEKTFKGGSGSGFDNYLDNLKVTNDKGPLSQQINDQIVRFRNAVKTLNEPYAETLVSNKADVDKAWVEGKILLRLLKLDMTSALGISISYTDNDGD